MLISSSSLPLLLVRSGAFTGPPLQAPARPSPLRTCLKTVLRGELTAGQPFTRVLGSGLAVFFQPIASGWILRVVPQASPLGSHDYAELATPPYNSVTPLSLSTDFAFRAQDAIGWNPRRFRFATSLPQYQRLSDLYTQITGSSPRLPGKPEQELSAELNSAAEGKLTIIDSRLIPGAANQWRAAAAVSSAFETTAHTFAPPPDGKPTELGRLLSVTFKLELALPKAFVPDARLAIVPHPCDSL